jgi:arylsulfatase A-like enzyme
MEMVKMSVSQEKPNILIIMTEHQQGNTVDADSPCKMPNIKSRLVNIGMKFQFAYTPTALCAPARASFFSGLYPSVHGMYNNYHSIPVIHSGLFEGVRLFSEAFKEAGYNLYYIGKWHVSGEKSPEDYGWKVSWESDVGPLKAPKSGKRRENLESRVDNSKSGFVERLGWPDYLLYDTVDDKLEDTMDYKRTEIAIDRIKRLSKENKPWMIYVGFTQTHDPYFALEKYVNMYKLENIPLPRNYYDNLEDKPRIYKRMKNQLWSQLTEKQVREAIRHYWALCTMTDELVGMILDTLEELSILENTIVIYTSDHGDEVGAHGLFLKGVLPFEESYRIPLIISWPKVIKPGSTCAEFVTLCDFASTFYEIANIRNPQLTHGSSFLSILTGDIPKDWTRTFYGQFLGTEYYYTQRIIRNKRYKYVFNGFDIDELYDLEEDPYELTNLANNKEYEEVKRELIKELWQWAKKTDDIIFNPYPTVALVPYGPLITEI